MKSKGKGIRLSEPWEPDPGFGGAIFLAWLAKRGQNAKLSVATSEWEKKRKVDPALSKISLEEFVSFVGTDYLCVIRHRGDLYLKLTKEGLEWADPWTQRYNVKRDHHGQASSRIY
ncbi:MAG: hypothetical protein JW986_07845 [Methanotrichaceae archaeon]|nr:hypothetical protein [Methanotrichaceae archaeon]